MNIETLIALEESKTLEFKENIDPKERILASVIALANTSGGKIIIGIQDKTKNITGIPNQGDSMHIKFCYNFMK